MQDLMDLRAEYINRLETKLPEILKEDYQLELYLINTIMGNISAECLSKSDRFYYGISPEEVQELMKATVFQYAEYINEEHDCDDYAFELKGFFSNKLLSKYAVGWCKSNVHAFNFFIDRDLKLYIIEPQGGEIMLYSDVTDEKYNIISYIL